jgi:hypothetical protein
LTTLLALLAWLTLGAAENARWRESKRPLSQEERWVRCLDGSPACQMAPDIEIPERRRALRRRRR